MSAAYHFTTHELSERWRVSIRTLDRWRKAGIGPVWLKIGRRVVYPLHDILAFERANRVEGGAQ